MPGHGIEGRSAEQRQTRGACDALGRGDADAHARERPRPAPDDHSVHIVQGKARPAQQALDALQKTAVGLAGCRRVVCAHKLEALAVRAHAAYGKRHGLARRVEGERDPAGERPHGRIFFVHGVCVHDISVRMRWPSVMVLPWMMSWPSSVVSRICTWCCLVVLSL